jgi:tetratricopeptide (TPR) repeat protein
MQLPILSSPDLSSRRIELPLRTAFRAFLILVLLGPVSGAASDSDLQAVPSEQDFLETLSGSGLADQIPAMTEAAERCWFSGEHDRAELIFAELLSLPVPLEKKREVLLRMADLFERKDSSRTIIILEKFIQSYPNDPATSLVLLRLGELYRAQGAFEVASARYFRVLNTTLNVGPDELETVREIATKARFELAEMLTEQGRLDEAAEVYRKIELLDLSLDDRMTVRFRLACVAFETRDYESAVDAFAQLREDDSIGPYRLETSYYLASGLKKLGRGREAFEIVVDLLRSQLSNDPADLAQSAYWKRRAGNELANEFYQQGEYLSALSIYQSLARISDDPEWRWPAVYQIGLCFEHLELPERALEAYAAMLEGMPVTDEDLVDFNVSLRDLAQWRLGHVKWMLDYGERFRMMTGSIDAD